MYWTAEWSNKVDVIVAVSKLLKQSQKKTRKISTLNSVKQVQCFISRANEAKWEMFIMWVHVNQWSLDGTEQTINTNVRHWAAKGGTKLMSSAHASSCHVFFLLLLNCDGYVNLESTYILHEDTRRAYMLNTAAQWYLGIVRCCLVVHLTYKFFHYLLFGKVSFRGQTLWALLAMAGISLFLKQRDSCHSSYTLIVCGTKFLEDCKDECNFGF